MGDLSVARVAQGAVWLTQRDNAQSLSDSVLCQGLRRRFPHRTGGPPGAMIVVPRANVQFHSAFLRKATILQGRAPLEVRIV
jgi:hypothetical protein